VKVKRIDCTAIAVRGGHRIGRCGPRGPMADLRAGHGIRYWCREPIRRGGALGARIVAGEATPSRRHCRAGGCCRFGLATASSLQLRQLLASARRSAHKHGERPQKKAAITRIELQALLVTGGNDLAGLRDRALLCFAFASGGRRRSEVAAATLAHLRPLPGGGFVYRLDQGKTLQDGPKVGGSPDKPLLGAAATALQVWLDAAQLTEGALFRRVWGNRVGPALSDRAIALIIQRRAKQAGLDGDFGGHSLRSGFITEGARRGVALPALMAMTDHRSIASVTGYYQSGGAQCNPAAHLLEDA